MKKYLIIGFFSAICTMLSAMAKRPNVILIYTDDHGYTDLGLFGIDKHVDTPVMDKLGPRFTFKGGPECEILFDSVRLWDCR